jgi:cob(I)alamin adenosyltransferase
MKVYTRRGDAGETDLFGGARVAKDHLRVEAYGAVDELNAALGVAAAASGSADVRALAEELQSRLFDLGAELAAPDPARRAKAELPGPRQEDVDALERRIDAFEQELAPLRRFVLPGGAPAAAAFHLARTVCRRAERRAVALARSEAVDPLVVRFLNRLSDLLFVVARLENRRAGCPDVEWDGKRPA